MRFYTQKKFALGASYKRHLISPAAQRVQTILKTSENFLLFLYACIHEHNLIYISSNAAYTMQLVQYSLDNRQHNELRTSSDNSESCYNSSIHLSNVQPAQCYESCGANNIQLLNTKR